MAIRLAEVRALPVRHVAGLISGTSMDGLDVALCRVTSAPLDYQLIAFETVPMPPDLRRALAAERLNDLAGLARLDARLGSYFAAALGEVAGRASFDPDLIGSHGQTVYHEHRVTSLQLGEPSAMALRFGCPVVHDFRAGDIAAGGCGAPLVPYLDHVALGGRGTPLLAVNIGGIANLSALPGDADRLDAVIGMDCGPGNMVLDQLVERFTGGARTFDRDGRLAAAGTVRQDLLDQFVKHPFFAEPPPKSAGREQFGAPFVEALLGAARPTSEQDWCDLIATASELTAYGVDQTYRRHVAPHLVVAAVVVSGGGARNPAIMARLAAGFAPIPVQTSDDYGLPLDAKEAIAFAILASERVDERPTNVPSVTGARRQVLLGKITEC